MEPKIKNRKLLKINHSIDHKRMEKKDNKLKVTEYKEKGKDNENIRKPDLKTTKANEISRKKNKNKNLRMKTVIDRYKVKTKASAYL